MTRPLIIGEDSRRLAGWRTQIEKRLDILIRQERVALPREGEYQRAVVGAY